MNKTHKVDLPAHAFLQKRCTLVHSFPINIYANISQWCTYACIIIRGAHCNVIPQIIHDFYRKVFLNGAHMRKVIAYTESGQYTKEWHLDYIHFNLTSRVCQHLTASESTVLLFYSVDFCGQMSLFSSPSELFATKPPRENCKEHSLQISEFTIPLVNKLRPRSNISL